MNSAEQVFELLQLGEGTFLSTCFIFSNLESDSFFFVSSKQAFWRDEHEYPKQSVPHYFQNGIEY